MIYVGGAQRTSTGYLWGIISKYLKSKSEFKSISSILSDNKTSFAFDVDGECMDVVQPLGNLGFNVLTTKYYSNTKNRNFLYYKNNFLKPKDIASNCSVFQTHKSMGMYKNHDIDKYISIYFFIHRNPFDEAASIVKAQSISIDKYEQIVVSNKLTFQVRRFANNNINYGIHPEDLQKAFNYLKRLFFDEIRFNALDFLKYKDNSNVYEFVFEKLTITNSLEEMKRIANILDINVDYTTIYNELQKSLDKGAYWNNKGKKIDTANDFFTQNTFNRLNLLMGDISVVLGYKKLESYSNFIANFQTFIILCIQLDNQEIENLKNIFKKFKKKIKIKNISKLDDLKFKANEKYIFCTKNFIEYKKINKLIDENSIIYPYYKALFGFEEFIFSMKNKKEVYLSESLLDSCTVVLDKESCNDEILLQKYKYYTNLESINYKKFNKSAIILLSYNQELIRKFTLTHINDYEVYVLLPMYNFDRPTIHEIFWDKP